MFAHNSTAFGNWYSEDMSWAKTLNPLMDWAFQMQTCFKYLKIVLVVSHLLIDTICTFLWASHNHHFPVLSKIVLVAILVSLLLKQISLQSNFILYHNFDSCSPLGFTIYFICFMCFRYKERRRKVRFSNYRRAGMGIQMETGRFRDPRTVY